MPKYRVEGPEEVVHPKSHSIEVFTQFIFHFVKVGKISIFRVKFIKTETFAKEMATKNKHHT